MRLVKKAIGKTLIGSKISAPIKSAIFMPEQTVQKNITLSVSRKGPHVSNNINLGSIVMVGSGAKNLRFHRRNETGDIVDFSEYLFSEEDVMLIRIGGMMRPYGKYVLVERINEEQKIGGIIIPGAYNTTDQSLFGVVVANGWINDKEYESNVSPGDVIHIAKWDMKIREVEVDGKYHLIVPGNLIDYKTNREGLAENYIKSCL